MKLVRLLVAAIASVAVAIGGVVATSTPAAAVSWSPQSTTLCSNTSRCGIGVPVSEDLGGRREGVAFNVNVTGQKGASVKLRAYAVVWSGTSQRDYTYVPVSPVVTAQLNRTAGLDHGTARVQVIVGNLPAGATGKQVLVQTADFTKAYAPVGTMHYRGGANEAPAIFEVQTSRGFDEGFAEEQFVNGVFHRNVSVAHPGQRYSVQMLRAGKWVTIDNPRATPAVASNSGLATIQGLVPADLPTGKYRTRIVNVTLGITDLTPDEPWAYFTWTRNAQPGDKDFDVYTTPGTFKHNGRDWRTSCEKYSNTERCRTEIWATQIVNQNGRYVQTNGWVFNNLTYKPSARSGWKNNPLGGYAQVGYSKEWTSDGRQWRTECDSAATGRGGCRSFIMATVIEKAPGGGFRSKNTWLFNNIVRFS